jgi:hypothetical protein
MPIVQTETQKRVEARIEERSESARSRHVALQFLALTSRCAARAGEIVRHPYWNAMKVAVATGMLTLLISVVALAGGRTAGQRPKGVVRSSAAENNWNPPRTPWGDPDLQGTWDTNTSVLLERPAEFAWKEFLTEEEILTRTRKHTALLSGSYDANWLDTLRDSNRTSLIVDPPDGKRPPLTLEAQERAKAKPSGDSPTSWEDLDRITGVYRAVCHGPCLRAFTVTLLRFSKALAMWPFASSCSTTFALSPSVIVRTSVHPSASGSETRVAAGKAIRWLSKQPISTTRLTTTEA